MVTWPAGVGSAVRGDITVTRNDIVTARDPFLECRTLVFLELILASVFLVTFLCPCSVVTFLFSVLHVSLVP